MSPTAPFGAFEIASAGGEARATIAPGRGGMLTHWSVRDEARLYLDEATFLDETKNVRGGNPVLFPSPGKLEGDGWSRGGRSGAMKQHGFARNMGWTVVERSSDAARLALESDASTRAQYPWDFRVELGYRVSGTSMRIEQQVTAAGTNDSAMPFAFGFHPYFAVRQAEKIATTIETGATRAFDNVSKKTIDLVGIDLTQAEVDLHLLDHGCSQSELAWHQGNSRVRIRGSEEYRHWVVWTVKGKDYVCLEPWTAAGDALNTGERLIELAPGARWEGFVELTT